MVSWSWHCVVWTIPYLLISNWDQVFCVNCNFLSVLVVQSSFCLVMFGEDFAYVRQLLLCSCSCGSLVGVQDLFRNLNRMGWFWLFLDIHCCMQTPRSLGGHSNCLAGSWYMSLCIVLESRWFFPFVHLFAGGKLFLVVSQFLDFLWFLFITPKWTDFLYQWWCLLGYRVVILYVAWRVLRTAVRLDPFDIVWNGLSWSGHQWQLVSYHIRLSLASLWWNLSW